MGAMENKGLNVFNTAYVLADESTATDTDFERVEGVIGHEVRIRRFFSGHLVDDV
jgi:aminopeptidase N